MLLSLETSSSQFTIHSYEKGQIKINDTFYHNSLIISKNNLLVDWRPQTLADLNETDLIPFFTLNPEIIILGSGSELIFPSQALLGLILAQGIGIEVMNTAAACRTYMILTAENRKAVAGLILS